MNDNQDPLWVYVGQISGVITIFGAVVVVIAVIFVVSLRSAFKWHITSAEVTWISFLAGVFASGIVSLVYGIQLFRRKLSVFRDQGKLSLDPPRK